MAPGIDDRWPSGRVPSDADRIAALRQDKAVLIDQRDAALARVKELEAMHHPKDVEQLIASNASLAAQLAEAHAELVVQARVNGIGSEREALLLARAEKAERLELDALRERDAFRRQVEAVERVKTNPGFTERDAEWYDGYAAGVEATRDAMKESANAE